MISPTKLCSLLSLSPGKFSGKSETLMRLHSYEDEILYRFPRELDTQGLSTNSTTIFVSHHQYHKYPDSEPITILNKLTFDTIVLPEEKKESLMFPTSIVADDEKLVIASNGIGFASTLSIYDISEPEKIRLDSVITLTIDQRRPMGLALDKNLLYFASYSEQTIWSLNLLTHKLDLVIDGKRYGITTPIAIALTERDIFVTSHVDKSIFKFDRRYLLPQEIVKDDLNLPWSLFLIGDDLISGNLGKKSTSNVYSSFLTRNGLRIEETAQFGSISAPIVCLF